MSGGGRAARLEVPVKLTALAGPGGAIVWALKGQNGDALVAALVALASIGFVALARPMRRGVRKAAEFFPPHVR